MEQKIKQDTGIPIGKNIRQIRLAMGLKQTEVVRRVQLLDVPMTRETLVKIERGVQHITASQFKALKEVLGTTYEELMK